MEDKRFDFENQLKVLCINDKYELLEKYKELTSEVKALRKYKANSRERYENMNKTLIAYMERYGSLTKKGKTNGVHK